mgnify:CR=1 FL=1
MKYTQIPANTFQQLQMNAGIFCRSFNPATGEVSGVLGATTGGGSFTATPEFSDFGEDIDNCPKNTMELKRLDDVTATMSTTFVTISNETARFAIGAADIDSGDETHIVPRRDLQLSDFADIWWVGDYTNYNSGSGAGYCAIHLFNALSTGGFQLQSTDRGKGNFAIELTGHYSIDAPDTVPYEIYLKPGTSSDATYEILLDVHTLTLQAGETYQLRALRLVPYSATVTYASSASAKATVGADTGLITAVAAGSATITASFTEGDVTYTDTVTVIITAAS